MIIASLLALVLTSAIAAAGVESIEEDVFRFFNDLPDAIKTYAWPVMQLGMVLAVPIAAVVTYLLTRDRLYSLTVFTSGFSGWVLAKAVKLVIERGRPGGELDDVILRGAGADGLGFVSGHAAVAFALAIVIAVRLVAPWRWAMWIAVVVAGLSRIYVGAHLPADVVGGWALGLLIGWFVILAFERFGASVHHREPGSTSIPAAPTQ